MGDSSALHRWLGGVIQNELGDLSALPQTTQQCVYRDYEALARAYLGWLRIDMKKPDTWLPQHPCFDDKLIQQMGHFFSDYQHLVARRRIIQTLVHRLQRIDPALSPAIHADLVREIESGSRHESDFNTVFHQLRSGEDNHMG